MFRINRKKLVMIMAGILVFMMVLSAVAMAFGGMASALTDSEFKALQQKSKDLKAEAAKWQSELAQTKKDKAGAVKMKEALEKEIAAIEEQVDTAELLINGLEEQIATRETEIAAAQVLEAEQFALFQKRIRVMEENQGTNYWGVLLKAESFSDFLGRMEVVNDIMSYDRQIMADLKITREGIEAAKVVLEEEHQLMVDVKAELEENKLVAIQRAEEEAELIKELEIAEATEKAELAKLLDAEAAAQKQIQKEINERAIRQKYVGGDFLWPLPYPYYSGYITSPYGNRFHPVLKRWSLHSGTDIGAPKGTKIFASNTGTVIVAGWSDSYGYYVVIDHGGGLTTLYGHMSKLGTSKGKEVTKGDVIGYVGTTGWSTGNHLHFEIRENGKAVDVMKKYFK